MFRLVDGAARGADPAAILVPCSAACWWPTAARSPSGRSAPPTSWAPGRSRSSRGRTATPSTGRRPTRRTRSASAGIRCGPTSTPRRSSARRCRPVRTRSTRATASCPRTRCWPRPVSARASPSSGRRPSVLHLTGNKATAIAAAREAGVPVLQSVAPSADVAEIVGRADGLPFPVFVKAVAGRRRSRDAPGRAPGGAAGGGRDRDAGGRVGLRRPHRVPRAGGDRAAAHRGADPGRRDGRGVHLFERDCSVQRRHQKVDRDRARPAPGSGAARPDLRRRGRLRPPDRLRQRRHGGVPRRPGRPARLHRDEPPHPGRAHGDRGGHRRRPGAVADAHRLRARPWSESGLRQERHPGPRRGAAVPDHDRGPGQRLPSRHRPDHRLPLARRRRCPPRRRYDLRRRRGQRPLRLAADQAHLSWP